MTPAGRPLDVLVVGAGVTGLATAFHLARRGLAVEVVEAAAEVGGAVRTRVEERPEGRWVVELGPSTVVDARPAVATLLDLADLAGDRLDATPAAARRLLWKDDALHPLPTGPLSLLATPLFSTRGKLRLLAEPFVPRRPAEGDGADEESVADFVRRRVGAELLADAVGPFVSGVGAGDPERLSMRWAFPRIEALEERHGGLVRGGLAALRASRRRTDARPPDRRPFTFPDGLASLPRRLAAGLPVTTGAAVGSLARRGDGGFRLELEDGVRNARQVVVTAPAAASAAILAEITGGAAGPLAEVPTAPLAVAAYGFRREQIAHPLDAFGFLAARGGSLRLLGCLFSSSIFPRRAPAGHVLLTTFAGGRTDPEAASLPGGELDRILRADLARAVGAAGEPVLRIVERWPTALPQYELGHGRFVALAEEIERQLPGLHLAGSYRDGVSVPDRLEAAAATADRVLAGRP